MDYSSLGGGLGRMLKRLEEEGTATKSEEADALLREDGNAILIGLLLDQRVLAETAFAGPLKLKQRLGHFDMARIADMDTDAFKEVFAQTPAVHRFVNMMADRVQAVAAAVVEHYGGEACNLWGDTDELKTVEKRVKALPGFGPLKAKKVKFLLHYFNHRTFAVSE
jgi:uncharacterized HhH-GPD family protein